MSLEPSVVGNSGGCGPTQTGLKLASPLYQLAGWDKPASLHLYVLKPGANPPCTGLLFGGVAGFENSKDHEI